MNTRTVTLCMSLLLASACGAPLHAEPAETAGATTAAPAPPDSPDPAAEFASLMLQSRLTGEEIERAESIFRDAARDEPREPRWRTALAVLQRFRGDAAGSLKTLNELARAFPRSAEVQYEIGRSAMATLDSGAGMMKMIERAGEARDAWENAVRLDPGHVLARYSAAQYYIQARKNGGRLFGSYAKAKDHADALLKTAGDGPFWGHLTHAQLAAAQKKWNDMDLHFAQAERAAPDDRLRRLALGAHAGALLRDREAPAAAVRVLERLIPLAEPPDPSAYYMLGEARKAMGDCAAAAEAYRSVLLLNPEAVNSRFALAECLEETGRAGEALEQYREFLQRFPKDSRASKAQSAVRRIERGQQKKG